MYHKRQRSTRSGGVEPLVSRSMANRALMRSTASIAIGALLIRARSKNLRNRHCHRQRFHRELAFRVNSNPRCEGRETDLKHLADAKR